MGGPFAFPGAGSRLTAGAAGTISVHPDGRMTSPAAAQSRRVDALRGWMEQLAEPTRLRILRALEGQELSVLELCEALALPQSTVSRHLKVLAERGWLASRRSGTQSLYRWADEIDAGARRLWVLARGETDAWPVLRRDAERLSAVKARKDEAQRFFAGAAGAWDRLRAEVYGRRVGIEALLALLPSEWTVADLGCGTGALAEELAGRVRKVIAVDQSAEMLRAARRRLARRRTVEIHEARLEALPLADASCDAAIAVLVLSYLREPAAALREAARVLRPGGRLVVVEAARHEDEELRTRMGQISPGFDEDELAAAFPPGLADLTCRTLPPDPGAKGPGLVVAAARRRAADTNKS
jgi:SAM-dependent methyltransferase